MGMAAILVMWPGPFEQIRSQISCHRNTYNVSIKFSFKSNKNIIQKINKGFTNVLTRP